MDALSGHVLTQLAAGANQTAYLYGFAVDQAALNREHERWLDSVFVEPALRMQAAAGGASAMGSATSADDYWHLSLCGTASRTGSSAHNMALSRRRVDAAAEYVLRRLGASMVTFGIDRTWVGEWLAIAQGDADETEDPLDRAVIVAVRLLRRPPPERPPPPAPPVKRPPRTAVSVPCRYVTMELDYLRVMKDAWAGTMASGSAGSFRDEGGMPSSSPDANHVVSGLRAKGWTSKRAWELAESGPYSRAPLRDAMGMTRVLGREIARVKALRANCNPDDPGKLCETGTYRYR